MRLVCPACHVERTRAACLDCGDSRPPCIVGGGDPRPVPPPEPSYECTVCCAPWPDFRSTTCGACGSLYGSRPRAA